MSTLRLTATALPAVVATLAAARAAVGPPRARRPPTPAPTPDRPGAGGDLLDGRRARPANRPAVGPPDPGVGDPGAGSGGTSAARPAVLPPRRVAALARDAGCSEDWVRRWPTLLGGVGTAIGATAILAGPVPAVVLALAVAGAPQLAGPALRRRRQQRRDEQLAPWLERVASGLRAGLALPGALAAAASATPWPLRTELADLDATARAGGLALGLSRWAGGADATPTVVLAASALDLGAAAGGEVARAVDRVAATLRDRMEARAEARALATQARASAVVLALAPLGFCALLATVEPAVPRILFGTPAGWACLAGGLGLELAGGAWMARIVARAR